ncbi:MAG: hypothetical protein HY074_15880 [Deltaproteobacteria bacterium]|nr:hypothetical protein [Deltaproteobacteria bacterium]
MAYTLQRIGKSLVKYFKPIRVVPPHVPGDSRTEGGQGKSSDDQGESQKGFRLLKFKKPAAVHDKFGESKDRLRSGVVVEETALEVQPSQLPEKTPTQWLEMVVFLLGACKRVSQKMTRKMGLAGYKAAVLGRGTHKLRTLGSIVDTRGEDIEVKKKEAA